MLRAGLGATQDPRAAVDGDDRLQRPEPFGIPRTTSF
jgi:hypothetical protein